MKKINHKRHCPIKSLISSEKSEALKSLRNQITLKCDLACGKDDVKRWGEMIFNKPIKMVRTMRCAGKKSRGGKIVRSDYKKAIITFVGSVNLEEISNLN